MYSAAATRNNTSPKYKFMSQFKSIPCYIPNGGEHFIVNLPLGQFTRVRLKLFCKEQLKNLQTFETMLVAKATAQNVQLLRGLLALLELDLKPKVNRTKAENLTSANEENLKPCARAQRNERIVNMVTFAGQCGLILLMFLLVFHLNYLETH